MNTSTNRDVVFDLPEQLSSFRPGINHLLVVGINDYRHVAKLSNAVRDAKCFVELMQEKYNFDAKNTHTLYDKEATKKNIAAAFRTLIDQVDAEKDNIVIYFSGHGHYDDVLKEGYWVPVEAKYEAEVDYIPYSYIKNVIRAIPSQHTVMIVDSCYSGSMLMGTRNLNSERFEKDPSRWMVASGRNEVVPDGVVGGNSPFAEKLLSILDRYADEGLRLGTLVEKLTTAVAYNSKQTPIGRPIYEVGDQGGEFFFHPKETVDTAWAKAQQTETVEAYTLFLSKYEDSEYAQLAREKLTELQPPPPPVDAPPQPPVAIAAVPQAVDQAPDLMDVRSLAAGNVTSLPQTSPWKIIWQKNKSVISAVAVALLLLTWLGIEYLDTSTGDEQVILSENALLKWDFAKAEQLALQAVQGEPDSEKAKSLLTDARKGLDGKKHYQTGIDHLKQEKYAQAIASFTAAEGCYTVLGYYEGVSNCQAQINRATSLKTDQEIMQAEADANTQAEREKAHADGQRKIKALADAYFAKGDYPIAIKEYEKLDSTVDVTREIRMAKLGADGKLPAMIAVEGHTGGNFYISPYEITNAQYCAFLNDRGSDTQDGKKLIQIDNGYSLIELREGRYSPSTKEDGSRPVTGVSWYGAQAYAEWAGGKLPTKSQWQYAARGGAQKSGFAFSGSDAAGEVAVFYYNKARTHPEFVGKKKPNRLGIYDLSGNVYEWCTTDKPESATQVIMGGSFNRGRNNCTIDSAISVGKSAHKSPEKHRNDLGFRMVRKALPLEGQG